MDKKHELITDRHQDLVWHAWAIAHDSHGLSMDTLVFLPAGDVPETDEDWVRVPWLDSDYNPHLPLDVTIEDRERLADKPIITLYCERCEGTGFTRERGEACSDCGCTGKI